jgi:hypothetical protein
MCNEVAWLAHVGTMGTFLGIIFAYHLLEEWTYSMLVIDDVSARPPVYGI